MARGAHKQSKKFSDSQGFPIISGTRWLALCLSFCISASGVQAQSLQLKDFLKFSASQKIVLPESEIKRYDKAFTEQYVADLANRRMFVRSDKGLAVYKMGIGRPASHIPFGRTKVTVKRSKPTWTPTPEARIRNPFLPKSISSKKDNPLGSRAMNTTWQYYLIHGTNNHNKIGRAATWGCMSLAEKDVIEVFEQTKTGAEIVVYKSLNFQISGQDAVGPVVAIVRPKPKPVDIASRSKNLKTAALSSAVPPVRSSDTPSVDQ